MGDAERSADASDALKLLLVGNIDEGLPLYGRALKGDRLPGIPIGLHLLFLERAGQCDAAAALLQLGLERGADLTAKAGSFGSSPAEAAAEYEAIFARGLVNSRMVLEYLRTLAELGRFEELRAWLDTPRLLRVVSLDGAGGELATNIEALILEQQSRAVHQEATQSVRNMWMLKSFTEIDHPAVRELNDAIGKETARYLQDWASSGHPLAKWVPKDFRVEGWALLSKGEGYNIPHVHQQGWATGVYYPGSTHSAGGTLHVGRPEGAQGFDEQWSAQTIQPQRSRLVLMPSFYTHWTIPLAKPGSRLSVAFDVLPGGAGVVSPAGFEPATY